MPGFPFPKQEKLKSAKAIEQLFSEGLSFASFPLRIVYSWEPIETSKFSFQFAATIPKKKFPKAVQRNRLRRQVKESFRLEKNLLYDKLNDQLQGRINIMFIYTAPEKLPYSKIERATKYLVKKLVKKMLANQPTKE